MPQSKILYSSITQNCEFNIIGQGNNATQGQEDNLYSGFGTEEVAPALQTEDLEFDEGFQVQLVAIPNKI